MIKPKKVGIIEQAKQAKTSAEVEACYTRLESLCDINPKNARRVRRILEVKDAAKAA